MTTIVLDGLNEEDFRRSIENRLREASHGAAIERLRRLLAPFAKPGGLLPERFLAIEAADLVLNGWEALGEAIARHDKPDRPVTAMSITFGWPGEEAPAPDAEGCLRPHVETSYYNDNAYPFSQSDREDLLNGYSFYGCTWSGDCEATEAVLSLEGIDDLHGALALLEAELLAMDEPDEDGIRAGSLGACLLSVLLVQAVAQQITRDGLPRPLCVMAGSSGIYPYFDAPVVGMPEEARKAAEALEDAEEISEEAVVVEVGHSAPVPRYSSLLMTGIPRAKKRAVLVLDESQDELDSRVAKLRSLNHDDNNHEGSNQEQGDEIHREAVPADAASETIDPFALPPMTGPLLAQKPARQARDLNEMFGLTALAPSPAPPAPSEPTRELAEPAEPAPPPTRSEPPVEPGFVLLESDIEQRLRELIAASNPPIGEALVPAAAEQPALQVPASPPKVDDNIEATALESRRAKAIMRPAPTDFRPPLGARLWGRATAWLEWLTLRR